MAGLELRGAQHAAADLFDGATWFLTPVAETDPERYRDLHAFTAALGATPVAIDPGAHDRLLALTSHLPHVLANLLITQAGAGRIDGHDPLAAVGGSFRDMTRVAGANARIWVDIYLENREPAAGRAARAPSAAGRGASPRSSRRRGLPGPLGRPGAGHRRRVLQQAYEARPEELVRVHVHVPTGQA